MTPPEADVFHRYDGAERADSSIVMPQNNLDARVSNLLIAELLLRLETFTKGEEDGASRYPWATRFVMGFPLPDWQRPLVWTDEQRIRFITSIWSGVDIGSYMINDQYEVMKSDTGIHFRQFSEILLDGQQRLSSIEKYVLNCFPVPDATGQPRFWRELPRQERRRFGAFHFGRASIHSWNEAELRLAYDLRAFGGTPHTPDQRASV